MIPGPIRYTIIPSFPVGLLLGSPHSWMRPQNLQWSSDGNKAEFVSDFQRVTNLIYGSFMQLQLLHQNLSKTVSLPAGVPGVGKQCESSFERTSETPETAEEDGEEAERGTKKSRFPAAGLLCDRFSVPLYSQVP